MASDKIYFKYPKVCGVMYSKTNSTEINDFFLLLQVLLMTAIALHLCSEGKKNPLCLYML